MILRWPSARRESPSLSAGAVHVWAASLDTTPAEHDELGALLSADELERAARFKFGRLARRFVAGRGILRSLVGAYAGMAPAELRFRYDAGKPSLETQPPTPLHFNLAHADDLAVYALSRSSPIGVDVERVAPLPDATDIAANYFASGEIRRLANAHDTAESFYRCWTRKEAFVKALGDGLAYPLDRFEVTLAAGEPARLLSVDDDPAEARAWTLHHLDPAVGFVGAVAVRGSPDEIVCRTWGAGSAP